MECRRRAALKKKYFVVSITLTLFCAYVQEVIILKLYPLWSGNWSPGQPTSDDSESTKVMFLADMHIMCTVPAVEPWLFRWDADKHQARGVATAIKYVNPDVVILLGDVFDQGYIATEKQWREYLECLHSIVDLPPHVKLMATVGDNDIGGEGADLIKDSLLVRYSLAFGPMNDISMFKNVAFVKVNNVPLLRKKPVGTAESNAHNSLFAFVDVAASELRANASDKLILLFGHIPLREMQRKDIFENLIKKVKPSHYFCGHIHRFGDTVYSLQSSDQLQFREIVIPTSSYRMGQFYAGLGIAEIDAKRNLKFSVLWFPPRFLLMCLLGIELGILVLFNVYHFTCNPRR